MTPFNKKPFKGKGEARRELREVSAALEELKQEMRALAERWNTTFRSPTMIALRAHVGGIGPSRVRWRKVYGVTGSQNFINLFGSDEGRAILQRFPPAARQVLGEFERQRMAINLRSVELHGRYVARKEYLEAYANLEDSGLLGGEGGGSSTNSGQ